MDKRSLSLDSDGFADLCLDLLSVGKSVRFTARGGSMQPLVRDGNVLLVEPVLNMPLRLGMVVLCFQKPDKVVVHRIITKKQVGKVVSFLIQGDHVPKPDGWFGNDEILGIVTEIDRDGKFISLLTPQAQVLAGMAILKSRKILNKRRKYLSYFYSKMKRLPVFKQFFQ